MLRATLGRASVSQWRCIHNSSIKYAASVFKMPAMSPTMTEGGIVSWKVKPGDTFNAGDVILEVETDKANIDVEAADDGKMWEILENEGAKGVPVGKAIAFLAEPDDDLNSLQKPPIEEPKNTEKEKEKTTAATSPEPKPESESKPPPPKKQEAKPSAASSEASIFAAADPKQKLSPAVELLLEENHISKDEAISKIKASGPNGRILKGDVLAYLGKINSTSIEEVTKFIKSREHLDLSKIVLASKEEAKANAKAEAEAEPTKASASTAKPKPTNILNVEITSILAEDVPKAKFKYAFENAIASAIQHTYAEKFPQYSTSPTASSIYDKYDLFEELVSAPVTKNRFEVYDVDFKFYQPTPARPITISDFDEILGLPQPVQNIETGSSNVGVTFKIKFDERIPDSKQFVETFENSLLSQIPANKMKITN
ncbi:uncharacterized protein LODBEIA_P14450 [Lodderomyces beijingensis]|uniref:Uncharacterized protein n=1 Tax=Lodderomyces beijingensis TaxID=1775926 RepID=A0ABP0ZJA8_9ASCO